MYRSPPVGDSTTPRRLPCSIHVMVLVMPKTGGRRHLTMLVSHDGHRALAERAKLETEGNVSELARRIFKYGMTHMPKGWK